MKRNFILIASVLMCASAAASWAQQTPVTEANYDMAERFSPNKVNRMVFSQTVNPSWFPNSDKFWYKWETPEGAGYWIVDPAAKSKKAVFDLDRLAMELTEIIHDPFDAQHIPFMDLKLKDDNTFTFSIKSTIDEPDTTADGKSQMKKKVFRFESYRRNGHGGRKRIPRMGQYISRQQLCSICQGIQPLLDGHGESPQTDGGRERLHRD